jgi:hypothetical protein
MPEAFVRTPKLPTALPPRPPPAPPAAPPVAYAGPVSPPAPVPPPNAGPPLPPPQTPSTRDLEYLLGARAIPPFVDESGTAPARRAPNGSWGLVLGRVLYRLCRYLGTAIFILTLVLCVFLQHLPGLLFGLENLAFRLAAPKLPDHARPLTCVCRYPDLIGTVLQETDPPLEQKAAVETKIESPPAPATQPPPAVATVAASWAAWTSAGLLVIAQYLNPRRLQDRPAVPLLH